MTFLIAAKKISAEIISAGINRSISVSFLLIHSSGMNVFGLLVISENWPF
ncbi:hypothetical protein HMPREF9551_00700 [Escherichia coli MS 196-1]|nr:hypothetical protein HMPREF9551_00700 [Escherichia coli MS 196-1]ESD37575.1 hypothetical protein HMPREF1604_03795 [Escherichia coli 908519]